MGVKDKKVLETVSEVMSTESACDGTSHDVKSLLSSTTSGKHVSEDDVEGVVMEDALLATENPSKLLLGSQNDPTTENGEKNERQIYNLPDTLFAHCQEPALNQDLSHASTTSALQTPIPAEGEVPESTRAFSHRMPESSRPNSSEVSQSADLSITAQLASTPNPAREAILLSPGEEVRRSFESHEQTEIAIDKAPLSGACQTQASTVTITTSVLKRRREEREELSTRDEIRISDHNPRANRRSRAKNIQNSIPVVDLSSQTSPVIGDSLREMLESIDYSMGNRKAHRDRKRRRLERKVPEKSTSAEKHSKVPSPDTTSNESRKRKKTGDGISEADTAIGLGESNQSRGKRRKIMASSKEYIDVENTPSSDESDEEEEGTDMDIVYIYASSVASVTGYNPHSDFVDLFLQHVYQDAPGLLQLDAALLNMTVESREETARRLMATVGEEAQRVLKGVEEVAMDGQVVRTGKDVSKHENVVNGAVSMAVQAGNLSAADGAWLQSELAKKLKTEYGRREESQVLQRYEEITGRSVHECNQQLFVLPIYPEASRKRKRETSLSKNEGDEGQVANVVRAQHPFCIITGMVDGVTEDLSEASLTRDVWELERVVVEVKNRISRIMRPIPLRDRIQVTIYMRMLGCRTADLVQALRHPEKNSFTIAVDRLTLEGDDLIGWQTEVMPRLATFCRAVATYRKTSMLRRELLMNHGNQKVSISCTDADTLQTYTVHNVLRFLIAKLEQKYPRNV